MGKVELKFRKVLNWGSVEDKVRVMMERGEQGILFEGVLEGEVNKNVLKLNAAISPIELIFSQIPIKIHIQTLDGTPIGTFDLKITKDTLSQEYNYAVLTETNSIIQMQIKDPNHASKHQLAKDCISILSQTEQMRSKRMQHIDKTNNFIKKREIFLKEYTTKQEQTLSKKKSLSKFMKELSSIKRELKSIDGASEEGEFSDEEKGRGSARWERKESREYSDAHSHY